MTEPFIWIRNGRHLPLECASACDMPTIEDIAHSLSQINRWTGWARYPLSVAQHSVLVSYLVPPELAKHGLLHDAHECVTGDINTPLKRWISSGELQTVTNTFDEVSAEVFGLRMLAIVEEVDIKDADLVAAYCEAALVMGVPATEVEGWFNGLPLGVGLMLRRLPAPPCEMLREMSWRDARDAFLARWRELAG